MGPVITRFGTFILKWVHSISIYFSVFIYMIPKRDFVPVQVNPELGHCSVIKFHSGMAKLKRNFAPDRKSPMAIMVKSTASRAYVFDPAPKTPFWGWASRSRELHSGTKLIPKWNSFRYQLLSHKQPPQLLLILFPQLKENPWTGFIHIFKLSIRKSIKYVKSFSNRIRDW